MPAALGTMLIEIWVAKRTGPTPPPEIARQTGIMPDGRVRKTSAIESVRARQQVGGTAEPDNRRLVHAATPLAATVKVVRHDSMALAVAPALAEAVAAVEALAVAAGDAAAEEAEEVDAASLAGAKACRDWRTRCKTL